MRNLLRKFITTTIVSGAVVFCPSALAMQVTADFETFTETLARELSGASDEAVEQSQRTGFDYRETVPRQILARDIAARERNRAALTFGARASRRQQLI